MSQRLEKVLEKLNEKHALILAQDDDVADYPDELRRWERETNSPARPVLEWDPVDGFVAPHEYPDELPDVLDLAAALEFVLHYEGRAMFLLDSRAIDLSAGEARFRKLLRQLAGKLADGSAVSVVLITAGTITASLSQRVTWLGDESSAAAPPAAGPSRRTDEYQALASLETFDTPEWEERVERMSPDEVEAVVRSGHHKDALERVNELRTVLKSRFARKDDIIDAICAASVAQVPAVLIGPPGTAKSNIIRCFCEGLGLTASHSGNGRPSAGRRYFEYLLTRYTTPEEIFGPIHVQELIDKQSYRRVTDGYLPEARVAFLDEIFKASSAILNTLLTLLNERIFYNGGQAVPVPLMMVFAASNEPPADEGLQALYDRFPLRLNCEPVDEQYAGELLASSWRQSYDRQFARLHDPVKRCACSNDLRLLRHLMRIRFGGRDPNEGGTITGGGRFGEHFLRLFCSLRRRWNISDRTLALLLSYCRAQALLDGLPELTKKQLDVFALVAHDKTGELYSVVRDLMRHWRL